MAKAIGIDLGTGFSAVAVMEGSEPVIIANSEGKRTTPSIVSFKDGERKIGDSASRQRIVAPKETVSLIKRFMGVNYDACGDIIKHMAYEVVNRNNKPRIVIGGKEYSPEEISAMIITKMKQTAEDYLGEEVTDAVITCPAWFDNAAREATKVAGEIAGLKVHRVINEPTAAILSAKIPLDGDLKTVLVADIGCGTTDFSVIELSSGMAEVKASDGDVFLGGSDFDNAIVDFIINKVKEENNGLDISKDPLAMQRLAEAAEKAKIELSQSMSTDINLPYLSATSSGPIHFVYSLTRAQFENLTSDLVKRIIEKGKSALEKANVSVDEIDTILLVGGQTRSLAIQNALAEAFGASKISKCVNPDEAVALGAAIQANTCINGESGDILLVDVTPISMGIETMGGVFTKMIDANMTIPCKKTEIFSTAADNQTSVDIHVLQGERPMAKDNKTVGVFRLDGIMPAKRGVPQIEVTFDIDVNGILNVSAVDKATNKEQHITIQNNALSKDEIERMKAEAEANADADKKAREVADTINKGESLVFSTRKTIEDMGDKLPSATKTTLEGFIGEMEKAVADKDVSKINELEKSINDTWHKFSEEAYSANANTTKEDTNSTGADNTKSEDNVEDATFEEVK